jgi:hypothetical protein
MNNDSNQSDRREYATKGVLILLFLLIFAGFVYWMTFRGQGLAGFELRPIDLVLLILATFRLGRLIAYDVVMEPLRRPFARTVPDVTGAGESVEPRGTGVRRALGQLLSCPICAGTWVAAVLVYGLYAIPGPTRVFLIIMAVIGAAELLNAFEEAFCWSGQYARTMAGKQQLQRAGEVDGRDGKERQEAGLAVSDKQNGSFHSM